MNKFKIILFIKKLAALKERQLSNEKRAGDLIAKELKSSGLFYRREYFYTYVPKIIKASLYADRKKISALGTSFVSGEIKQNSHIISSLISSQKNLFDFNINFNPKSLAISRSNFYFAPSLAISKRDLSKVLFANNIEGLVKAKKIKHRSSNILVGNNINPKYVFFCHYDSLGAGACDNASGTAVLLKVIIENSVILDNSLFIFSGNEEISYDCPVYWGHGYRVFEKVHRQILNNSKKIIVVDSIGVGETILTEDQNLLNLAFPLKEIKKISKKSRFNLR